MSPVICPVMPTLFTEGASLGDAADVEGRSSSCAGSLGIRCCSIDLVDQPDAER